MEEHENRLEVLAGKDHDNRSERTTLRITSVKGKFTVRVTDDVTIVELEALAVERLQINTSQVQDLHFIHEGVDLLNKTLTVAQVGLHNGALLELAWQDVSG